MAVLLFRRSDGQYEKSFKQCCYGYFLRQMWLYSQASMWWQGDILLRVSLSDRVVVSTFYSEHRSNSTDRLSILPISIPCRAPVVQWHDLSLLWTITLLLKPHKSPTDVHWRAGIRLIGNIFKNKIILDCYFLLIHLRIKIAIFGPTNISWP